MAAQEIVVLLERVQIPLATPVFYIFFKSQDRFHINQCFYGNAYKDS